MRAQAIGSPDPYGRQLDGMGGGVSSLSKVCIVGPPTHPDADVDYTFAQVQVKEAIVDYSGNCGNMLSAIGPYAVDEGLVNVAGNEALVRVHNTNTHKLIHARFPLAGGTPSVDGNLSIPGVPGTAAPVQLQFLSPAGATTGKLLPTGSVVDTLDVPGVGAVRASMVDAANACCFVAAADLGLTGTEMPDQLDAAAATLAALGQIRLAASVAMGIARDPADAARRRAVPYIGYVSPPQASPALAGPATRPDSADLTARMLSNGQPHRALPLTAALCLAVAARIDGTIVHAAARLGRENGVDCGWPPPPAAAAPAAAAAAAPIRIAMPSGVLVVGAEVRRAGGAWEVGGGSLYRTQRRMFEGFVYVPASRVPALAAEAAAAEAAAAAVGRR